MQITRLRWRATLAPNNFVYDVACYLTLAREKFAWGGWGYHPIHIQHRRVNRKFHCINVVMIIKRRHFGEKPLGVGDNDSTFFAFPPSTPVIHPRVGGSELWIGDMRVKRHQFCVRFLACKFVW